MTIFQMSPEQKKLLSERFKHGSADKTENPDANMIQGNRLTIKDNYFRDALSTALYNYVMEMRKENKEMFGEEITGQSMGDLKVQLICERALYELLNYQETFK